MAKQFEIQLEFTTKGANKLIESLKILAQQQNKVSAAQRKFNNANLKAVTATKKLLMAQEKHRFAMLKNSTQVAKLKEQIRQLRMRNKQLAASIEKTTRAKNRMRISTAGLQRTIGSIRNKILLVTFAFGGMAAGIRSSVEASMQFEAVKTRLNSMFGSVVRGEKAFQTFNQVAATTPFTLTDVVEAGASLKAFGTNAEEMIKPTSDLAAFMGTTATEAAQALGRAFAGGAGAADILRERGILQLIRDTKGIEDLSKLTLPQFRKALEETLLDPEVGIAGATDALSRTMVGAVSNMADAFTRMKAAIGDFVMMKGLIGELAESFENVGEFFMQLSETPLDTTIRKLDEMGQNTTHLKLEQAKYLQQQLEESGNAITLAEAKETIAKHDERKIKLNEKIAAQETAILRHTKNRESIIANIGEAKYQEILDAANEVLATDLAHRDTLEDKDKLTKRLMDGAFEYERVTALIKGLEEEILRLKQLQSGEDDKAIEKQKTLFTLIKENFEQIKQVSDVFTDQFGKVLSLQKQNLDRRIDNEIKALKRTEEFQNASMERRQTMEDEIRAKFAKQQQQIFEMQKKMNIAKIIMDTAVQLNKLIGDGIAASLFDPTAPFRAKAITAGLLTLSAKQIDLVSKQQAPAFARGGSFITGGQQMIMVGDNPGGRERVDITPLSSPDFGDAGGSGSINVNIMGNVIGTQEFVRDNLLPEIQNTIKRNLA
jgi:hypothetical protein